jgi:hypothetical protein
MRKMKRWFTKKIPLYMVALILGAGGILFFVTLARGEQSGSSPSAGATSRFKTLADDLVTRGYGSTASGAWGDWGASWNRIYSSAIRPAGADLSNMYNGTGVGSANCTSTFALNCYTQAIGGVDDYNNNNTIPSDTYKVTWTTCAEGNNYCGTGRSVASRQDPNTGLVWSVRLTTSNSTLPANTVNWFVANNCKYPNELPEDDGTCNTNGEVACYCVKLTSSKTGCDSFDDGGWRLPYQKELMQAYINGSRGSGLDNLTVNYWSATTRGSNTQNAWVTLLTDGPTVGYSKTTTNSVRCVRP